MHWLTKMMAVFAAVLSILLAALAVAYSTNAERITSALQKERQDAASYQRQLEDERSAFSVEKVNLETQLANIADEARAIKGENERLALENGRLLADTKTAEASALAIQSRIDQLAATGQTQATLIDSMYQEVSHLRDNELLYAQREIQLGERINDLSGQLEVATENNRALQERLVDLQRQMDTSTRLASGGSGAASPYGRVEARITDVRRDPVSGKLMAQINAGTSDRIQTGMQLSISRGNEYIGRLTVDTATLNEAAGQIDTFNLKTEAKKGDLVWTGAPGAPGTPGGPR